MKKTICLLVSALACAGANAEPATLSAAQLDNVSAGSIVLTPGHAIEPVFLLGAVTRFFPNDPVFPSDPIVPGSPVVPPDPIFPGDPVRN